MKRVITLSLLLAITLGLAACDDYAENTYCTKDVVEVEVEVCNGSEGSEQASNNEEVKATNDNEITFTHIAGHGGETEETISILFEYQSLKYTKYQIAYQSCTWRPAQKNYKQVAYVELNNDGTIRFMSYDVDSDGDYTPAVWGDSSPIPPYGDESLRSQGKTKEEFMTDLVNGFLVGKSPEDLEGLNSIDDLDFPNVDTYAGSSVSVNNMLRAIKALQEYHLNK